MVLVLKKGAQSKEIQQLTNKLTKKITPLSHWFGFIKLKADAVVIQKQLRDEW